MRGDPRDHDEFMIDAAELAFRHRSLLLLLPVAPIIMAAVGAPAAERAELATGGLLASLGAVLRIWAVRAIGKRARVRHAGAKELLIAGPYARVRNPLYIANSLILAGLAVAAGCGVWTLAILAGAVAIYSLVIRHEEDRLEVLFGTAYDAYVTQVPRWLPRLWPAAADEVVPWPWPQVLRREAGLVAGVPLAIAGIGLERDRHLPVIDATLARVGDWIGMAPEGVVLALIAIVGAIHTAVEIAKRTRHEEAQARLAEAARTSSNSTDGP